MDVDVPTPAFTNDVAIFVDSLSLPEHNFWKVFVANGGTDIEVFNGKMAERKRELDDIMAAEKAKQEDERAVRNRPLLSDAIETARIHRERAKAPVVRSKATQKEIAN